MKVIKRIASIQFLLLVLISCDIRQRIDRPIENDDFYEKCRKIVLSENKIHQEYFFKVAKNEINEFKLTYLGNIKTAEGDTLRFINAINYFGIYEDSKRANSKVFIYNTQNKRIGFYHLGGALDVPTKIEGSDLIFSYENESCNQTTAISFLDSIPSQIFINCTEKGGDLYTFTLE